MGKFVPIQKRNKKQQTPTLCILREMYCILQANENIEKVPALIWYIYIGYSVT